MIDNRSKYFVFVPFCLLAQSYQAQGIVKYEWRSSIKPIVQLLIDEDINIIQLPCSEASFDNSLIREPRGLKKYDNDRFNEHTLGLAKKVALDIKTILDSGYKIIAILGIEQSPSCCVNYIYTNEGMKKTKGLFMSKLYEEIKEYNIPFIGINRKHVKKSLNELKKLIEEKEQL